MQTELTAGNIGMDSHKREILGGVVLMNTIGKTSLLIINIVCCALMILLVWLSDPCIYENRLSEKEFQIHGFSIINIHIPIYIVIGIFICLLTLYLISSIFLYQKTTHNMCKILSLSLVAVQLICYFMLIPSYEKDCCVVIGFEQGSYDPVHSINPKQFAVYTDIENIDILSEEIVFFDRYSESRLSAYASQKCISIITNEFGKQEVLVIRFRENLLFGGKSYISLIYRYNNFYVSKVIYRDRFQYLLDYYYLVEH